MGFRLYIVTAALLTLAACGSHRDDATRNASATELKLSHSTLLQIDDFGNCRRVAVRNPWDTTALLHTYVLVDRNAALPSNLPEGTLVRTPLERMVVYSGVHQQALSLLDASHSIAGICDAEYLHDPELTDRLARGEVADCGSNLAPSIERIVATMPDAILLSPYQTSGDYGKLAATGIPMIECADYMEPTPLGRAEWIKFIGMLVGRETLADSLFEYTEREYLRMKDISSAAKHHPSVIVDGIYGQGWTVPSRQSTTAIFIKDAGGVNPFDYLDQAAGTTPLSPEQVLAKAADADLWLYRYYQRNDKTLSQLGGDHAVYTQFDAFRNHKVYGCNTASVPYYEEVPFRPHLLLEELVAIFHPELADSGYVEAPGRYFTILSAQ